MEINLNANIKLSRVHYSLSLIHICQVSNREQIALRQFRALFINFSEWRALQVHGGSSLQTPDGHIRSNQMFGFRQFSASLHNRLYPNIRLDKVY